MRRSKKAKGLRRNYPTEGWKCPVCRKGNAPFAIKCGHCKCENYQENFSRGEYKTNTVGVPVYDDEGNLYFTITVYE